MFEENNFYHFAYLLFYICLFKSHLLFDYYSFFGFILLNKYQLVFI
ncbi:hypothetical protein P1059_00079 [Pasteurella multocida subsp. gallicida P1059]|nr:hypothetical protein P1059_00079 [Pasteurella multocida subsp. gallicida P1059]